MLAETLQGDDYVPTEVTSASALCNKKLERRSMLCYSIFLSQFRKYENPENRGSCTIDSDVTEIPE